MKKNEKLLSKEKVYVNMSVVLICQIFQVLLGFFLRKIFINTLGVNYLGYNSVFSSILQMLNLADLGIGVAITSFLYKPLVENDNDTVSTLMYIYKRIYNLIGIIVAVLGILISFFLDYIIKDATCSSSYLRILFYINLLGTVSTYFLAYKRTLLIALQKTYFTSLIDTIISIFISIIQICILYIFPSYIIYLILNILKNIINNFIISFYCSKKYKNLSNKIDYDNVKIYVRKIIDYVKDLIISKIGAYVFYSTDSIIISYFKGSLITGFLSNYLLVTNQVTTIFSQILASIQSTFGLYINSEKNLDKQKDMSNIYICANFFLGNFCMTCILFLIQPFIKMLFGEQYLLSISTVIWLSINLMLNIMLQVPSQLFIIYNLYKYDKYIISISALLNISISIIGVNLIGVNGVYIGTFISSLIYLVSRLIIVNKKIYNSTNTKNLFKLFYYAFVSVISNIIIMYINELVFKVEINIILYIFKILLIITLAILVQTILLIPIKEFNFLLKKFLTSKIKKICIIISSIIFVIVILFTNYINKISINNNGSKSLPRMNINYNLNVNYSQNLNKDKIFHFSLDDSIKIFEDITNNNYDSIFENSLLNYFQMLHEKYEVVVTFYVYYEDIINSFELSECTDKFKNEFSANSSWLRFGFHTLNSETNYENTTADIILEDYKKTIKELIRITGSEQCIDNVIRLQNFAGNKESIEAICSNIDNRIIGLLTADDNRNNYYLDKIKNEYIYNNDYMFDEEINVEEGGIWLFSTDLRLELIDSVDDKIKEFSNGNIWNNQLDCLVVFSHEWAFDNDLKQKLELLVNYAKENNYLFEFQEEYIKKIEK